MNSILSTRRSRRAVLCSLALATALALSACAAPGTSVRGDDGVRVDLSQPVQVALLVPLGTGDSSREAIARSLVNAAELARADLRDATIDLRIYETRGSTDGGAAAASRAVAEGASIIVGPLFSTATAGAGPIAEAAGLKVLALSNNPSVAGGNVFLVGPTFRNTASQLIGHAQARGLDRVAVVYPNGIEGETARDAVRDAAQGRGAALVSSQGYDLSVTGINAASGPIAAALQTNGANAVILTDGPTGGLGFIADALRSAGLAPASAVFMGMQRWDVSGETLALPSLQGGVFAAPGPGPLAAFNGRYQNAYGERPHELAVLAYDGINAVGAMIAEARASGGSPFSTARLTQPRGFAGASGPFRFTADGLNQRNLAIFEVRGGQAVVISPANRSFDAAGS